MKKGDEHKRWGPEELAFSNFGGQVLSGVRGDQLATNYAVELSFLNPQNAPNEGEPVDVVRLVEERLGISQVAALQRLCGLRIALHEYIIDLGVRGWSDQRLGEDLRALVVALDSNDLVLAGLPEQELAGLIAFRRG